MNVSTRRLSPLEIRLLGRKSAQAGVSFGKKMGPAKPMQEKTAIIAESHKIIVQYLEVPSNSNYILLTKTLSESVCQWCLRLADGDEESWRLLNDAVIAIIGNRRRQDIREKFIQARKIVKKRTGKKIPYFEEGL